MTEMTIRSGRVPKPEPKRARVRPNGYLPPGFAPRCWALWKYEWRYDEGKAEWESFKPTCSPRTLRKFTWREQDGHWHRSLERGMWGTFGETLEAYRANAERFDGIGYVLEPRLPLVVDEEIYYVVTDLDDCRDPETGGIEPWAEEIVDEQGTFAELSPSGTGVHLIGHGRKPPRSKMVFELDGRRVENYGGGVGNRHFMTYTGVAP
jgi:putative DNA primase/helicase